LPSVIAVQIASKPRTTPRTLVVEQEVLEVLEVLVAQTQAL
jgi:hypothetical protein